MTQVRLIRLKCLSILKQKREPQGFDTISRIVWRLYFFETLYSALNRAYVS